MQYKGETHIDKVFRDGLKDFQFIPPPEVWDGVAIGVSSSSRKRWVWIVGAAASLLLFLTMTWLITSRAPEPSVISEQTIINTERDKTVSESTDKEENLSKAELDNIQKTITSVSDEPVTPTVEDNQLAMIEINENEIETVKLNDESNISYISSLEGDVQTGTEMSYDLKLPSFTSFEAFSIQNIEYNNSNDLSFPVEKSGKESKWGMGGSMSPIYSFRHTKTGENQDMSYFYDSENAGYGFTGTISAIFKAKKRLTIQTGVQFYRSGVSRNDVLFYSNPETGSLLKSGILRKNIPYPIESSLGTITSGNNSFYLTDFVLPDGELYTGNLSALPEFEKYESFQTSIVQSFEFLEIPFLVRYKLIDRKFGLNIMSGVGTSFLVGNDVFMNYQDQKVSLGQTEDVSTLNFTGSFGLGFEYSFNPKLSLNFEPTFKYFLNSFNLNPEVSTHPYFFGIYSGLSFYF